MCIVKNFMVTSKDLNKIMSRGCRLCKGTDFRACKSMGYSQCNKCGAKYSIVSESALDVMGSPVANFSVYRSASIDNPGEEYDIETNKTGYVRRKSYNSER